MRCSIVMAILLMTVLSVVTWSEDSVVDDRQCVVFEQELPPGRRLWVYGEPIIELDGSQPSYIGQGWGTWPNCFSEMAPASVCDAVQTYWEFELRIDGALVAPDYIAIYRYDPAHPTTPPSDLAELGDLDIYILRWIFAFPAEHFAPGVYILEGTWTVNGVPCDICPCEEGDERTGMHSTRTSTLSVTFPPSN
ncbi:hypothetical protein KAH43_01715 [Candidatus Bipolaricaulota bacterium]|nr:hypothetical protein [Candidatus Bipolaricaulota bacterium]